MALKLGKCRLCLKLGDFYSIFTTDNDLQLSEMVMECTRIKIFDGDGLPDKVCSECIQKLSSAYIFKQQCERADLELRRNYVPPPGFTPPPPNRQSSDSAFSNQTDISYQNKPSSSTEAKVFPATRKRSHESIDNASSSSQSHDYNPSGSLKKVKKPKPISQPQYNSDTDFDDNSASVLSAEEESDSQRKLEEFPCPVCGKCFATKHSMIQHSKSHARKSLTKLGANAVVNIPKSNVEDAKDVEDKLTCEKCGRNFKLKIMLKRHYDTCENTLKTQKELLITLEPVDAVINTFQCEICTAKFKTEDKFRVHMKAIHSIKSEKLEVTETPTDVSMPCIFCKEKFNDYYLYTSHFNSCSKRKDTDEFECPLCQRMLSRRNTFFTHIRNCHFETRPAKPQFKGGSDNFACRICNKKLSNQNQLIEHLAAHMSNMSGELDESGVSSLNESKILSDQMETPNSDSLLDCSYCAKQFKGKKWLMKHLAAKHNVSQLELPSTAVNKSLPKVIYKDEESDSSHDEIEDNTCDICEKQFSYRRTFLQHKRLKHNMSSGHKRAKINLKDCEVRCLICDIDMKVSDISEHNQTHISANLKPRNLYTCVECSEKFQSCTSLATHIKIVHRLKQSGAIPDKDDSINLADFCEVVVTKAEPLDDNVQSYNDSTMGPSKSEATPLIDLNGFTCPICNKKMGTLISLKRHVNWHSNVGNNLEKAMECFVCKEKFKFKSHYRLHMRGHYTDTNLDPKLLTCTICNRRSKHLRAAQAHMNFHKQTRFKNKDYECSICGRVFQYRRVYLSHMAIHFKRGESVTNTIVGVPNAQAQALADAQGNTEGSLVCKLCGKVCDSEVSLKHHTIWHSSKTMLYGARHECSLCHLVFTNKRRRELHMRTHFEDDNGPYKCNICGKGFIDEGYFNRHVKGHNFDHQSHQKRIENLRKHKVKCPICARYYPDLVKLIRHLRRTHPQSKMIKEDPDAPPPVYYSCQLCAKVFLNEQRLKNHEERHQRKPKWYKCKFCSINSFSLKGHRIHIKAHMNKKFTDDPLDCPQCDEKFYKGYHLHYHLRDVHGILETWIDEEAEEKVYGPLQEFQCSVCFKILANKGNFERHIDYHNTLRCNYCFEYFTTQKFLDGHLVFSCEKRKLIGDTEVHLRKIKCDICYKAFHLQVKLDCHLRARHDITVQREASEGKKEFVCDFCFRVFENEDSLVSHKLYHRTVGYFGCIYCNRKFNTITVYNKHKTHHFSQLNVDEPTKCEHCDKTFVPFRDMIYHMRDEHGDDKEWITMPKESIEEKCNICNKVFLNLHRHLEYHEENRCKKCGEYFFSMSDYDNHLCAIESDDEVGNLELSSKPAYEECRFCFKPITKKDSKLKHDKIHRGSGAISCRFCPLKFKTIDAFNIHAFTHRSRKYKKKPLKCRDCGEKFVQYGPFMKHLKSVHKLTQKMHYRATVIPDKCIVCGDDFPNLHNHYRAHLQNQCQQCHKYFTSHKVFSHHECDKEDLDPSKVFVCNEDLNALIKTYVPRDRDEAEQRYYGFNDEDDAADAQDNTSQYSAESEPLALFEHPVISGVQSLFKSEIEKLSTDDSQDCSDVPNGDETVVENNDNKTFAKQNGDDKDNGSDCDVIVLDEDSVGFDCTSNVITID